MKTMLIRAALLGLILSLAACNTEEEKVVEVAEAPPPAPNTLNGNLTYVEDIILAPETIATVQLVDVTDETAEPVVVAETQLFSIRRPPLPYAIEYDKNQIKPDRTYQVRSFVMEQTRLMFKSIETYPVFTGDEQGPVEIHLTWVPGGDLNRMAHVVRENNPTISGYYYYEGKQGEFLDCADESIHPVAREEGIHGLERSYRREASSPGDMVFTTVTGNYVTRPARNGNGKEDFLVVIQVEEMDATGACP